MNLINKILIIIFFTTCNVRAQVYFNKRIDFNNRPQLATSVLSENNGYVITGAGFVTGAPIWYWNILFVKTDLMGDTIIKKYYGKNGFNYSTGKKGSLTKTLDNGYAVVGVIVDPTVDTAKALLMKFDQNGDTLWSKSYGMGDYDIIFECRQTNNGGFILAGATLIRNGSFWEPADFYLIKTDSLGNLIWQKKYGGTKREELWSVEITNDGCYLVSGFEDNLSGDINAVLFKVDSLGNKIWQKNLSTGLDEWLNGAFEQDDGSYIVYGARKISGYGYQDYIAKLDSNRNIIWEKTYGTIYYETIDDLKELDDGSFIGVGSASKVSNPSGTYAKIVKFCANGDTLWTRIYGRDDLPNYAYAVNSALDGGFIFCGNSFNVNNNSDMWLVKTDSLGCDSAGCLPSPVICPEDSVIDGFVEIIIENPETRINAYPNPFTNETTIILPYSNKEGLGLIFTLYNILGEKQDISYNLYITKDRSEIKLNRGDLQPGLYFYKVKSKNQTISTGKLFIN